MSIKIEKSGSQTGDRKVRYCFFIISTKVLIQPNQSLRSQRAILNDTPQTNPIRKLPS